METEIDSLWLFALASKCRAFSSANLFFSVFLLGLAWISVVLLYWSYPGGPAWGKYWWKRGAKSRPIPGPRGLPILGSMNLMAHLAHHKLAATANRLGAQRLMAFSIGETRFIITSNPDVAKEILHSSVFADRPVKESAYGLMFHRAIGFAPYGTYWRTLRRIAGTHLFCPKQINGSAPQRSRIAGQMVSMFGSRSGEFRVRDALKRASLNSMMCSVFGRVYDLNSYNEETRELSQLVEEGYELLGKLNWSDHLPLLVAFDPQKTRFRCSKLVQKVNRFVNRIISEHKARAGGEETRDFVDVLLSLQGPDKLSEPDMAAVLWEMIFRGTDTVAILMEWILARMVLHPDLQSKVHQELDNVIERSRQVMESDILKLRYLQAVVKEVLRLHPPGPLLSWARLAIVDTNVAGSHVPAGTTAMVNMWAITRDPQYWPDPLAFKPDRFFFKESDAADAGDEFSILGSDLRFAPFGSGRRSCPGKGLGLSTVTFWVASLLHEFEWGAADHYPVDLSEVLRLSCEMEKPLLVKIRPRRSR